MIEDIRPTAWHSIYTDKEGGYRLRAQKVLRSSPALMSIGVLGEYIGKIYEQAKNRPLYLVSRTFIIVGPPKHQHGSEFTARSEYR
jgi:hypothetical protein